MSSRIYIEDIDLVKVFIDKWIQYLDGLEKEIIKIEIHWEDIQLLNNIFECIKKIKRESSFVGLCGITRLSYEVEKILEGIRDENVVVNTELIDGLLLYVNFLNGYIARMHEILKEQDFISENGSSYLEFQYGQKEEQILEGLKLAFKNSIVNEKEESKYKEEAVEEEISFAMLQSDEFKYGLAKEMKEQFLLENTEHIERIENDFLIRLDSNCDDKEAVNEIFRAIHSVKGGTGIYIAVLPSQSNIHIGLEKFLEVVHTFESLLMLIRDNSYRFGKDLVDFSLLVMDYLKSFISSVDSEEFNNIEDNGIIENIKQQISNIQKLPGSLRKNIPAMKNQTQGKADDTKSKSITPQTIRVNQEKIDKMMNMISELLIVKNSFMHISAKLNKDYDLPEISKEVKQVGAYVNRISDDLQNAIMSIRMVEIKTVFQKMPRVIRDIAQSTGKKMELHMEGESTEIDKTIIEQISDPLVHLIRNAADHGIENLQERLSKGKPETGRIVLRAYNKNKNVFIEIEDDGKGIDEETVMNKAIEKGIISEKEAETMNQSQLINLIFLPGFSMAKKITEVSGRGVGMDIVKSNISKINGNIKIESEVDKGTKMIIQLPLTLAVSRGLIVEVGSETYIIPLDNIVETVKINTNNIHKFNGKFFTYLRGEAIGIEWLCEIFLTGARDTEKDELNALILSNGIENYAIIVDKLKNEQEFVVKTLDGYLSAIPGISGSTLLGNGKVVLIVNPVDLF